MKIIVENQERRDIRNKELDELDAPRIFPNDVIAVEQREHAYRHCDHDEHYRDLEIGIIDGHIGIYFVEHSEPRQPKHTYDKADIEKKRQYDASVSRLEKRRKLVSALSSVGFPCFFVITIVFLSHSSSLYIMITYRVRVCQYIPVIFNILSKRTAFYSAAG